MILCKQFYRVTARWADLFAQLTFDFRTQMPVYQSRISVIDRNRAMDELMGRVEK